MTNQAFTLCTLLVAGLASTGCSERSSAKPAPAAPPSPAVAVASPASIPAVAAAAPSAPPVDCEQACTDYAICYEAYYEGESYKGGGDCVTHCNAKAPQDRAVFAATVAAAVRTKQCAAFMAKEEGGSEGEPAAQGLRVPLSSDQEPHLGCFAWAPATETIACVVGEIGKGGSLVHAAFLGSGRPSILLVSQNESFAPADAAAVAQANEVLAKHAFTPLAGTAKAVKARGGAVTVDGVSISIKRVELDDGGPAMPSTADYDVLATCKGKQLELHANGGEGVEVSASVRRVGAGVLVEVVVEQTTDLESRRAVHAMVVNTATCAVVQRALDDRGR